MRHFVPPIAEQMARSQFATRQDVMLFFTQHGFVPVVSTMFAGIDHFQNRQRATKPHNTNTRNVVRVQVEQQLRIQNVRMPFVSPRVCL